MYNMMLIEDEPQILNAMVKITNWEKYGFNKPHAYSNGKVAIEDMQKGFVPDAVITDINMPFVDGFGVAKYINENFRDTLIIILTGYDDFNYAHKAIKLKVLDYVLKPVTPKMLNQTVSILKNELDNRRIKELDKIDILSKERFFVKLLTSSLGANTILENLKVHNINFKYEKFLVLSMDIESQEGKDSELMHYGMCNIAGEMIEEYENCVGISMQSCFVVLINKENEKEMYEGGKNISECISKTVKETLSCNLSCGISKIANDVLDIHLCYEQSVEALDYRFFYDEYPYIFYKDIHKREKKEIAYDVYEKKIQEAINKNDKNASVCVVKELISNLKKYDCDYEDCVRFCQKLVLTLIRAVGNCLGRDEMQVVEQEWEKAKFFSAKTLGQMEECVLEICEFAFFQLDIAKSDNLTLQVSQIIEFIQQNYMNEELSLSWVCKKFTISISYFSAIFKEKTGTTFVKYLTNYRIEKAKQSLIYTEKRSSEISAEVGFWDPHYFSITFKKLTGMTPKEYRNSVKSKN